MDLWGNVLRSPSQRTKSPSFGDGGGKTMELQRDEYMHNEEMHMTWGGRVATESEPGGNNLESGTEGFLPGKQGIANCIAREGSGSRGEVRIQHRATEEEARKAWERVFDVGLIGRGGIVAPDVENVVLIEFVEPKMIMGGVAEGNRQGIQVDLNEPISMEDDGVSVMMQQINGTDAAGGGGNRYGMKCRMWSWEKWDPM